jgi:hypothetical protein
MIAFAHGESDIARGLALSKSETKAVAVALPPPRLADELGDVGQAATVSRLERAIPLALSRTRTARPTRSRYPVARHRSSHSSGPTCVCRPTLLRSRAIARSKRETASCPAYIRRHQTDHAIALQKRDTASLSRFRSAIPMH